MDCSGNRTRLFYDDFGRVKQSLNPLQQSVSYDFSPAGRLVSYTLADGSQSEYDYNALGLCRAQQLPDGRRIEYTYNARGQATTIKQANGSLRQFEFDEFGRLIRLVNEQNGHYRFDYDELDRLVREHRLDGTQQVFDYNGVGDVISQTVISAAGRRVKTDYRRDKASQITHKLNDEQRTHYQYEKDRLIVSTISQSNYEQALAEDVEPDFRQVKFEFDKFGRLLHEHNHMGRYDYAYDKNGNLTGSTYPDGSLVTHLYYGTGHSLQSDFERKGSRLCLAEFSRDNLHREVARSQGSLVEKTYFDAVGRITQKVSVATSSSSYLTSVINRHYQYDKGSQLIHQRTIWHEGSQQSQREESSYTYDLAGQIIRHLTLDEDNHYHYDLAGNLLDGDVIAEHNQVTRSGHYLYRYDDLGRQQTRTHLLTGEVQTYHYNLENQLIKVSFKNSRRASHVTYSYDGLGRRISKTVYPISEVLSPKITYFHWQGMVMTGEHRDTYDDEPIYYLLVSSNAL